MPRITSSKTRQWLLQLATVCVSSALALTMAELTLRWFFPVRGMIYTLDDRYLFRLIPGSRKLAGPIGQPWPRVLVRINDAGRRGDESGYAAAPYKVVVYGDSFVAAEFSPEPETYVAQLEQRLNRWRPGAKVLNAGVTGYGVDQESLRIEDDLPVLGPDLVVIVTYVGNDFGDLLRDKLYRVDRAGQIVSNAPVIGEPLRREFQAPFDLSSVELIRGLQSAYQHWAAPAASDPGSSISAPERPVNPETVLLDHRRREYERYVLEGYNVVENLLTDEYDADVSLEPDSASARYRAMLMTRVIERVRGIVEHSGTRFLLVIAPERCDVGGACDASARRRRYTAYRPSNLSDIMASVARNAGVIQLNLFEPFQQVGADRVYHALDQHWNAAGQALAAQLTAEAITSSR